MWARLRPWLLAVALALPFFWRLDLEEFHGDESHWISSGQQAFYLLTRARLRDPQWREEFYFYSQPQIGKVLIGAALAAAGIYGSTPIYDYDWQLRPWQNQAAGRVPPPEAVLAGRVPGALAGWLSCLLLWLFASRWRAPRVGSLVALLLATHPLWLANSRRAGLDTTALCLGLAAACCVLEATNERRTRGQLRWWPLAGVLAGLALGTKYVALLSLLAGAGVVGVRLRSAGEGVRAAAGTATAVLAAGLVFVATNPALYEHPVEGVRVSVDFLVRQAQDMRRESAGFQAPGNVALEIVDRAIWPIGYPEVVDRTLPDPLKPGSYGTPAVALGVAVAIVIRLGEFRFGPWALRALWSVATLWVGFVFLLLALSIPTWWERWHLPLIPPLCLLAGAGLACLNDLTRPGAGPRTARRWPALAGGGTLLAGAQAIGAVAMLPTYLGRGFGAIVAPPWGAAAHLAALALALIALVSQCWRLLALRRHTSLLHGAVDGSTEVGTGRD